MKHIIGFLFILASCGPSLANGADAPDAVNDIICDDIQTFDAERVATGHWRSEWMPAQPMPEWRICASPADTLALWFVGESRQSMLAQSAGACLTETTSPLDDTPLRAGELYRVVVIGEQEPTIILSRCRP